MGPKTISILMYSVCGKISTVPVDSHVYETSQKLGWSNWEHKRGSFPLSNDCAK